MSADVKSYKEKLKLRYLNKKRQASIVSTSNSASPNILAKKTPEQKKIENVQKVSEKYLKEELEVENHLKLRQIESQDDLQNLQKHQRDVAFFCEQYPIISDESEAIVAAPIENDGNLSPKSDSHSSRSTHNSQMASTYIQPETDVVIEKFELTKIEYDEDLLFYPTKEEMDEKKLGENLRKPEEEGFYIPEKPLSKTSNHDLMIKRLIEDNSTDLMDESGDLKSTKQLTGFTLYRLQCDKEFIPIYVPPIHIKSMIHKKVISEKKFLKIYISHLGFDHHPLFTSEHVVAKSLENLYEQYINRISDNIQSKLETKLKNLRQSKTENTFDLDEKSNKIIKNDEIILLNQIKLIRQKLHKEEKYNRNLLKNILENWKTLKSIRKQQGYAFTKQILKIQKIDVDHESDKNEWQKRYDNELNEMIEEEFSNYHFQKQKYKEYLKKLRETDEGSINVIKKPKKPDIEKIIQNLNEIFENAAKPVGEPEIILSLAKSEDDSTPAKLKFRKLNKKIEANTYFVKLSIDNEVIGNTKHCQLNENFYVNFNSAFIIKLTKKIPEIIKLIIFEQHNKVNKKMAEIIIPLPDDEEFFSEVEAAKYEFTSKRLMTKINGSRKPLNKSSNSKKLIRINGKIMINCGWTDEESEENKYVVKEDRAKKEFSLNHVKLKSWYDDNLLNPMDPDTGTLIKIINTKEEIEEKEISQSEPEAIDKFRFNEEDLAFCSEEEFNNNERFNQLIARYKNDIQYKNKKFIPHFEREIEPEKDRDTKIIDESVGMDPIDLQRHRGRKYLKRVYEIITNHCENLNRDKLNTNILTGDHYPIGTLSLAFLDLFGPKRPLKPTRRTTSSRASCKITELHNFNIVITVVRGFGVPVRIEETQALPRKGSNISANKFASFKTVNVRPYVTISLKDQSVRTTTAEGTNPCWNEQLKLPLNTNSDQMKKFLTIDLFDECIEDLIDNVNEVYQRISSKWLGELKIPISTICTNQRIEGTFEITTPQILMGYSKPKFSPVDHTTIFIENLPDMTKRTNISLFISLEPYIDIPDLMSTGLECIEIDNIETHIKLWFEQMKLEFPQRAKNPLVTLLNGKRACITRLLSNAINIPFEKNEYTEYMIRRFVSLIPIYYETSNNNCSKLNGIWLSNNHVLGLLSASSKDLGVLLTCFYLELGYDAWLVLGNGLSSGESCFVLIKEMNDFYVIDPTSGRRYSCKDIYCPLTVCYCLVNQYNMWANIQRETRVFMTQFDVNKSLDWRPLFSKGSDIPNTTVHETQFTYEHSFNTEDLQKIIQSKIIKKINSWRSHRKTVWNRFVSENLRNILVKMEEDVCFENESEDNIDLLNTLFSNYKVTGYTLNMKYTNLSSIVAEVKNTGIHLNLDNKVEFAVSVYIKEYANNVISIWIFLMSLTPKI